GAARIRVEPTAAGLQALSHLGPSAHRSPCTPPAGAAAAAADSGDCLAAHLAARTSRPALDGPPRRWRHRRRHGRPSRGGLSHSPPHPNPAPHPLPHTNTDATPAAHTNPDAHADIDTHANTDNDADVHADFHANTDSDADVHADFHA